MQNELLTVYVGIIAICMVVITAVIIFVGIQSLKTMKRLHEVMGQVQNELSFLSTKVVLTLHEVNELMRILKEQSGSLASKSMQILHESHSLISYFHNEIKNVALKVSGGIAKVTVGSIAVSALAQFFKKKS